jgi:hypothetical protein
MTAVAETTLVTMQDVITLLCRDGFRPTEAASFVRGWFDLYVPASATGPDPYVSWRQYEELEKYTVQTLDVMPAEEWSALMRDTRNLVDLNLGMLGDTAEQVADNLYAGAYKGLRANRLHDPLCYFLEDNDGIEVVISRPNFVTVNGVTVLQPEPVREFVLRFDSGDFPHLVDPED